MLLSEHKPYNPLQMNKSILNFGTTLLLAALLSTVLPWWSVMLAGFVAGMIFPLQNKGVFFAPFLALFLYWGVYSFVLSSANNFILARKIAQLLQLGTRPIALILLTGILGGIAAGISGMLGKQLMALVK